MSSNFRAEKREIFHARRLKKYPSGAWELLVCNRPIFREKGWELEGEDRALAALAAERSEAARAAGEAEAPEAGRAECTPSDENTARAARRAAARVRDIALSNAFSWFVTLTLDKEKIDRFDVKAVTRKLNTWLDNQVRRKGLKYVLVAERHKDGAIHFHGLINEVPGLVPSGTWKVPGHKKPIKPRSEAQRREWAAQGAEKGFHEVFNWEAWPLGFTTAIRLYGNYDSAVAYVCKYIRKQVGGGKLGGRWYYSGGALEAPAVELVDIGLQEFATDPEMYRFEIPEAGLQFGILRGKSWGAESSLQKPESEIVENSEAEARGGAPANAESRRTNVRERRKDIDNGIPVGKGVGGRFTCPDAGKSSCGPGEFTHGLADFRRSEPQTGPTQAPILHHGAENREEKARQFAGAAPG